LARKPQTAANARGEVWLDLGERKVRLKLTVGVLADVEDELGIESLDALPMSGKAIIALIVHLARAAGETVTDAELRAADLDIHEVVETIGKLSGRPAQTGNAPAPSV